MASVRGTATRPAAGAQSEATWLSVHTSNSSAWVSARAVPDPTYPYVGETLPGTSPLEQIHSSGATTDRLSHAVYRQTGFESGAP